MNASLVHRNLARVSLDAVAVFARGPVRVNMDPDAVELGDLSSSRADRARKICEQSERDDTTDPGHQSNSYPPLASSTISSGPRNWALAASR